MQSNLNELFMEWQALNEKVAESFGQFDLSNVKELRKRQREIEDIVYEILIESAPNEIKEILPEECGDMEIGYKLDTNTFYYVMFDPDQEDDETTKLLAVTLDLNKNVNLIEDFKLEEE